jgi:hypothetical protein
VPKLETKPTKNVRPARKIIPAKEQVNHKATVGTIMAQIQRALKICEDTTSELKRMRDALE